jgi:pimeloyl-ACP methyl ester carboxylesterase
LHNVTLVGWSYGGVVTTGVSARITNKIKSMIYLDAFVPEDGKALIDYVSSDVREM